MNLTRAALLTATIATLVVGVTLLVAQAAGAR